MLYQPKRNSLHRQGGVVVVIALLIVAFVVAMSYTIFARLDRDTKRTMLLLRDTQARQYAQGSLAWAVEQLHQTIEEKNPKQLSDGIWMRSPVNQMNGYQITSVIYDRRAKIKLIHHLDVAAQKLLDQFSPTFFLVETSVSIENQHMVLYTLLERQSRGHDISVNINWQSRGEW